MSWKRVLRTLVCFLLICCILINWSPIRAKAVVTEALAVTGAGVFATMFAIAMGLVAVDLTVQLINGIGDSMTQHLYQWGSSAEKLDEVESFLTLLPPQFDNDSDDDGGDDGSEDPSANTFVIPTDILDGLIDWAKGLINGEGVEVEGEAAPEGYAYYNGVLLPVIPIFRDPSWSEYEYAAIVQLNMDSSYQCYVLGNSAPPKIVRSKSGSSYYFGASGSSMRYRQYELTDGIWVFRRSGTNISSLPFTKYNASKMDHYYGSLIWGSVDAYDENDALLLPASEPVYVGTETVIIPNYVGDIPQQVKDGTFDEEAFVLPYINYALPFQGQLDAVSALNNLSTQLMDQTLTYDQYMELIKTEAVAEPVTGTLADTDAGTFLDALADIIMAPFRWLWQQIQDLFVPSEDFLTEKVDSLCDRFSFADSIVRTGQVLFDGLSGISTEPPVIYVDLGAFEGSYDLGGKVAFVDLHWYSRYKPTVDAIISSFLWACFVWRLLIKLPGIINGASGAVSIVSGSGGKEDV